LQSEKYNKTEGTEKDQRRNKFHPRIQIFVGSRTAGISAKMVMS